MSLPASSGPQIYEVKSSIEMHGVTMGGRNDSKSQSFQGEIRNIALSRSGIVPEKQTDIELAQNAAPRVRWVQRIKVHSAEAAAACECIRQPTDLFRLSVRGGVVGDFEAVEIQNVPHLVIVSPPLANNHGYVE